jgi:hypothetical protein
MDYTYYKEKHVLDCSKLLLHLVYNLEWDEIQKMAPPPGVQKSKLTEHMRSNLFSMCFVDSQRIRTVQDGAFRDKNNFVRQVQHFLKKSGPAMTLILLIARLVS